MSQKHFLKKLKDPHGLCTILQMRGYSDFAEMAGYAGFDAVIMDCQHGDTSMTEVKNVVRAAQCGGAEVLIRTWKNDPELIDRYLESGAAGILFIDIHTKEDAARAVELVKCPPIGRRSPSGNRADLYGFAGSDPECFKKINERAVVALMIENRDSIENLKEIAAVPGVDLFCMGPSDLSRDLGHPGESGHPEVVEWENRAYEIAAEVGIPMDSVFRPGTMDIRQEMARGRRVMTLSLNGVVANGYREFMRGVYPDLYS